MALETREKMVELWDMVEPKLPDAVKTAEDHERVVAYMGAMVALAATLGKTIDGSEDKFMALAQGAWRLAENLSDAGISPYAEQTFN